MTVSIASVLLLYACLPTLAFTTPGSERVVMVPRAAIHTIGEGYLLTSRQGFFNCYEGFIHIVDAMVNQHAKRLTTTRQIT